MAPSNLYLYLLQFFSHFGYFSRGSRALVLFSLTVRDSEIVGVLLTGCHVPESIEYLSGAVVTRYQVTSRAICKKAAPFGMQGNEFSQYL
jgi:hypothetical protein